MKRRVGIAIALIVLFAAGLYCGSRLTRLWAGKGTTRYETPVLLEQVQTLSELVTVKYVVEKVEIWEDPPSGLMQFVAGDNRILLLARGVVKAGVDFKQLKPEDLRIQGKTIWINLPPARVTDAYLDDKETKVIERTTGFLRSFDKDLEQNIRRTAVEDMRTSATRGGILRDANERARTQLASFFHLMGFERVEFNVPNVSLPTFGVEGGGGLILSNSIRDTAVPQNQPH
ncbi:MAG TPA: DUF4230 domain-containing protein [Verrucomicrobiae bacterium]|nr:DUF4230 domain-containing protein [Verrucomicrobiae bacterium]